MLSRHKESKVCQVSIKMTPKDDSADAFEQLPSRAPSLYSTATRRPPSEIVDNAVLDGDRADPHDVQTQAPADGKPGDPKQRWWEMSLVLKNTGSVARDHLASERTFLAWMRTSVSLAMAGVGECECDARDVCYAHGSTVDPPRSAH